MGGERITDHVDEDKALDLQREWYIAMQKYKGVLDAIAFYYEKGYQEGLKCQSGKQS
jgi:hypothetical protein